MITPVNFEIAKLLKEKGFNEECMVAYTNHGNYTIYLNEHITIKAPNILEVVIWIHEKYGIWIGVNKNYTKAPTFWNCITLAKSIVSTKPNSFNTAEEAYEAAIEYILNEGIIKSLETIKI